MADVTAKGKLHSENLRLGLLVLLGCLSLASYFWARSLQDLRQQTINFEIAFYSAFLLYFLAVLIVLRSQSKSIKLTLGLIFFFAILFRIPLLTMKPTLSDDMFRYVWDGRVQANGISPYRYPTNSPEVAHLRWGDSDIWRNMNRKSDVTIYPPGAQASFLAIWHLVGDSATGFKAVFVLAELFAVIPLLQLLRKFEQPMERSLIYLWSPLLIYEVAHAGHLDALLLPILILALWARVHDRPWLLGMSLGLATLIKLIPIILLPALLPLSPTNRKHAFQTAIGLGSVIIIGYLPYMMWSEDVIGFLPLYLDQNFNMGLAWASFKLSPLVNIPKSTLSNAITFGGLAIGGFIFLLKPATSSKTALLRCVWLIGWFTLFTQNLFPWYLLWLLPFITLFLEPGKFGGIKLTPIAAWFVFTGTVALAYTFFINWRVIPWAQRGEFFPLYLLILLSFALKISPTLHQKFPQWVALKAGIPSALGSTAIQQSRKDE